MFGTPCRDGLRVYFWFSSTCLRVLTSIKVSISLCLPRLFTLYLSSLSMYLSYYPSVWLYHPPPPSLYSSVSICLSVSVFVPSLLTIIWSVDAVLRLLGVFYDFLYGDLTITFLFPTHLYLCPVIFSRAEY